MQSADFKAAIKAELISGTSSLIVSRQYSEMRLAHLAAAGDVPEELRIS